MDTGTDIDVMIMNVWLKFNAGFELKVLWCLVWDCRISQYDMSKSQQWPACLDLWDFQVTRVFKYCWKYLYTLYLILSKRNYIWLNFSFIILTLYMCTVEWLKIWIGRWSVVYPKYKSRIGFPIGEWKYSLNFLTICSVMIMLQWVGKWPNI